MSKVNFFSELKRRNVYKVAVAYAIVGWIIAQIATQVFPFLEIPKLGRALGHRSGCDRIPHRTCDRVGV